MATTVIPLRQSSIEASLKQAAFERHSVPTLCIGASAFILLVNEAAARLLDKPVQHIVGRHASEFFRWGKPQGAAKRWSRMWAQLSAHQHLRRPVSLSSGDGQQAFYLDAQLLHEGQDAVAVATLQPIDRTRLRKSREQSAKWATLEALRPGLSAMIDADQKLRWISAGADTLSGVATESLTGLPFEYLLDEASAADFTRLFQQAQQSGEDTVLHALWRLRGRAGGRTLSCRLQNRLHHPLLRAVMLEAIDVEAAHGEMLGRKLVYQQRVLDLALQGDADVASAIERVLRAAEQTLHGLKLAYWACNLNGTAPVLDTCFDRVARRLVQRADGQRISGQALSGWLGPAPVALIVPDASSVEDIDWPWRTGAVLMNPVSAEGKLYGALIASDPHVRYWAQEDTDFMQAIGRVLAHALRDVQRKDAEARAEQLAWYDPLTGLPNRHLLRESMRRKLSRLGQGKARCRLAVMLVDLDRFKDVNDTLGHLVGDTLIKSAAQVIVATVGEAGMVARLGGDEFVILADAFEHRQEISLLAERVVQALNRTDLVASVDTQVSASIGVALFPEHGKDVSTLLKNADAAMYQAKRDGRNRFGFFNSVRYARAAREVQLGVHLHKALQFGSEQFFIEYQPQVEAVSGRVVGLEALIRWQHPTLGRLTPNHFIGVAETSGLSERISRWLLNTVCEQIQRWRKSVPGFDIPVAINVSGRELGSSTLPLMVRAALLKHQVEPHMIVLEITERTLVQDSEVNNDVIIELAALGIGMVLDDFGTGFSMLAYLKRMPIHALKIDQSFVKGVPADADSCAIVQAVIAIAQHFKLKVVAEGIERQEQVDYLRSVGCGYMQGYLYSKALAPDEVIERSMPGGA